VTSKRSVKGSQRWPAHVAVFTNLTRDHLDMHGSPEAYLAAKAQLFMSLGTGTTAVLNADDAATELLREVISAGVAIETVSVKREATLAAREVIVAPGRTRIVLAPSELADALGGAIDLGVSGGVHAQNALGAALAARAAHYSADEIKRGLESFRGVAGRFEMVCAEPLIVVDYAHTPDGLVGTLTTARELAKRRVICVFGCGGDRDRGKRPQMAAIVDARADVAVLTTDNPRFVDPPRSAARSTVRRPRASADRGFDQRRSSSRWPKRSLATSSDSPAARHEKVQEIVAASCRSPMSMSRGGGGKAGAGPGVRFEMKDRCSCWRVGAHGRPHEPAIYHCAF
jgi:UDP-N-acetylmuramyl tripeptide synthase